MTRNAITVAHPQLLDLRHVTAGPRLDDGVGSGNGSVMTTGLPLATVAEPVSMALRGAGLLGLGPITRRRLR